MSPTKFLMLRIRNEAGSMQLAGLYSGPKAIYTDKYVGTLKGRKR